MQIYREYNILNLPESLLSQLNHTRKKIKAEGENGGKNFRTLGNINSPVEKIPPCITSQALQKFLDNGVNRLRADDDARAFFRYDTWVLGDNENQNLLKHEINKFIAGALPSGFFWYPSHSFMGWHTNSNRPGQRLFCTYVEQDRKSFFRYRDPETEKIQTCWEKKGWNVRSFFVGDKPESFLWHCVYSSVERMSFGFYKPIE